MAKAKSVFVCQECGYQSIRWLGRCPECGEWNTMVEENVAPSPASGKAPVGLGGQEPIPISEVETVDRARVSTGIGELDRILGGGTVIGSAILIGGDPGIGKSTLLLQLCEGVSRQGLRTLYVSGEESLIQTKLRAERLDVSSDELLLVAETNLHTVAEHIKRCQPQIAVIDSIQMMYKSDLGSAPGSVSQVRECAGELVVLAKSTGTAVFLIGHVTKGGVIAGPRVLEHIVDTVLYFEGDKYQSFRILRAIKNRFGSTNEIGIFEMRSDGLIEVPNPSALFLAHHGSAKSGAVVMACMEGTRALLVEVQALVSRANFGTPERKVTGVDYNRVAMLLAVLEKRAGLMLGGQDVFVNVVGGVHVDEPAADLGAALAIASSFTDRKLDPKTLVVGEVGLGGETRAATQIHPRLQEAARLGFERAIIPQDNEKLAADLAGLKVRPVATLTDALEELE